MPDLLQVDGTTVATVERHDLTADPDTVRAIVIPPEGPLREIQTPRTNTFRHLYEVMDCRTIEAMPMTPAIRDAIAREGSTVYADEDGKMIEAPVPNMRATDFMVPGVGIRFGDFIAGTLVLLGLDPADGTHRDVPDAVVRRARLIADESGAGWLTEAG